MPHAISITPTTPSEEFYDYELPTTLIPPRRVYRPLAATFFETEAQDGYASPASCSVLPVSVSRYIKSLSSTVESFAGELCDDPAIQSVLNCRRRKAGAFATSATQSNYNASLSAGSGYFSTAETLHLDKKNSTRENHKRGTQCYSPSMKERTLWSDFQQVNDIPPRISSPDVSFYVRDKLSYPARSAASFNKTMVECPKGELGKSPQLTKPFDIGCKRNSSYFTCEDVSSNQSMKRTKLAPDNRTDGGRELCISAQAHTGLSKGTSTDERRSLANQASTHIVVFNKDHHDHEVHNGTSWSTLAVNSTGNEHIAATIAIAKDPELKISINCKEDIETPCISNLMRLACAAGLARIAQTSKPTTAEMNHIEEPAQIF